MPDSPAFSRLNAFFLQQPRKQLSLRGRQLLAAGNALINLHGLPSSLPPNPWSPAQARKPCLRISLGNIFQLVYELLEGEVVPRTFGLTVDIAVTPNVVDGYVVTLTQRAAEVNKGAHLSLRRLMCGGG